jgi:hypothetical protein
MGLADLKKNSTPSNTGRTHIARHQHINIEDFIDEATHYAAGLTLVTNEMVEAIAPPSIVNTSESLNQLHAIDERVNTIPKTRKTREPYRKATFTLSESAISHLAELASGCDMAKSKLIRSLIEHHYSLNKQEALQKESSIIHD